MACSLNRGAHERITWHTSEISFYFIATKRVDGEGGGGRERREMEVKRGKRGISYNWVKLVNLSKMLAGRVVRLLLSKSLV